MAQKTFVSEQLTSADVNLFLAGEGGAHTSWSPTVTQGVNVTVTNTRSTFARYGRTIHFSTVLTVTGSGTAGQFVNLSLPTAGASGSARFAAGSGHIRDVSATTNYPGLPYLVSTTVLRLVASTVTSNDSYLGATAFTAGLAVGDVIDITGTYEAAA